MCFVLFVVTLFWTLTLSDFMDGIHLPADKRGKQFSVRFPDISAPNMHIKMPDVWLQLALGAALTEHGEGAERPRYRLE